MGNDVADLNNDGLVDVMALDMLPRDNERKKKLMGANSYQGYLKQRPLRLHLRVRPQYTMQINMGNKPGTNEPIFADLGMMADVAETDWSWTPLLADFDHDGYRDLIVTNGFPARRDRPRFCPVPRRKRNSVATKDYLIGQISNRQNQEFCLSQPGRPDVRERNRAPGALAYRRSPMVRPMATLDGRR